MTLEELQKLAESNAKSIQAGSAQISETDAISRRHSDEIATRIEMITRFSLDAAPIAVKLEDRSRASKQALSELSE